MGGWDWLRSPDPSFNRRWEEWWRKRLENKFEFCEVDERGDVDKGRGGREEVR